MITVLIPTIGTKHLKQAILSVLDQSVEARPWVIVDGEEHWHTASNAAISDIWDERGAECINLTVLPENTHQGVHFGHRIHAAFTHLVNTEHIAYLDEDNWYQPDHLESLLNLKAGIACSYRGLYDQDGKFIKDDLMDSCGPKSNYQGEFFTDTSCWLFRTKVAVQFAHAWNLSLPAPGGRTFSDEVYTTYGAVGCTYQPTLCYRTRPGAWLV